VGILDLWARRDPGVAGHAQLPEEQRATFQALLQTRIRNNTYDAASGTVTMSSNRVVVIASVGTDY
jgi:nitric oxide reductase subunit B